MCVSTTEQMPSSLFTPLFVGKQAIRAYKTMLRDVYGPELVLEPIIMSQAALYSYDHAGACTVSLIIFLGLSVELAVSLRCMFDPKCCSLNLTHNL